MAEQTPAVEELTRRVTAYVQSLPDLASVSLRTVREQFEPEFGDQIPNFKDVLRDIVREAILSAPAKEPATVPAEAPVAAPVAGATTNSPKPNLTQSRTVHHDALLNYYRVHDPSFATEEKVNELLTRYHGWYSVLWDRIEKKRPGTTKGFRPPPITTSPASSINNSSPLPEDTDDVVSNSSASAQEALAPAPASAQEALAQAPAPAPAPAPVPIKRKLKTAKQRAAVKEQLQAAAIKDPKTIQEWGEARAEEKKTQATLRDAAIRFQKEYEFLSVEDKGLYTFTSDGNLQVADKRTIPVRKQIRASPESINQFFKTRQGILSDLEKEVTAKHRDLLRVLEEYRAGTATRDAVVAANQDVQDAERALNVQAKLPRAIVPVADLSEKDLFPEKRGDTRKIAEPVVQVAYTTFPYKIFWTPEPTANQVAAAAASSAVAVAGVQEAPTEAVAPPTAEELAEIERKKKARQAFFASRAKRGGGTFRVRR